MRDPELEARLERLERAVDEIRSRLPAADAAAERASDAVPVRSPDARGAPERAGGWTTRSIAGADWRRWIWDSELWLNKLGVALVLFGVTFLFRYSIEQGWLTPAVRVVIGLVVGGALLGAGLRLADRQRSFAQVLLGGGIATFYIVGFAAFQLYALVGYVVAFGFMVAVTTTAFALAMRAEHPVLSLIGIKGALGTPFLLYSGTGHFPWLVAYTCLVVAAAVALFLWRGWRSVLWTAFAGGWAVLGIAYWINIDGLAPEIAAERWILQAAVLACWAMFALAPARFERGARPAEPQLQAAFYLVVLLTPALALGFTGAVWSMAATTWGALVIAVAAAYAVAGAVLRRDGDELGPAHLLAGSLLLPVGMAAATSGDRLYLALAAQGAVMHWLAGRLRMHSANAVGNLLFATVATWFVVRLDVAGIANTRSALGDVVVLGLALAASSRIPQERAALGYRLAVHAGLLAWLWRELAGLPHGAAWVSVAWSAYGLALLVAGLRRHNDALQRTALATLLVMVAKLFVVDLAALEAIWRILLFLGVGGGFLVASYLLQGLWSQRGRMLGR